MENRFHLIFYPFFIFMAILILVFQSSFLSFFFVRRSTPDLLLIVVLCFAFFGGENKGLVLGLIAGFCQDIIFGPAIGIFTLAKMLSAFLTGLVAREIYKDQIIGPALTVFFITFFHEIIIFFMISLWGGGSPQLSLSLRSLLPRAVSHLLLTIPIYPLLYRAGQKNFFHPF
ncbi:MAG: rod shape-determining protein MreD [Firmicutes bacterium]|nr:rod shape-determining protein MreD [Bacillota bacterium]